MEEVEDDAEQIKMIKGKSLIYAMVEQLNKGNLNEVDVIDEMKLLMFAAYETTATVLTRMSIYLALHPHVQTKLKEEIKTHIPPNTKLTYVLLSKLIYLKAVVKEVLRLTPIAPGVSREVLEDDDIDGIKVKKGDIVGCAFYCMHMDTRFWKEDPSLFMPERFMDIDGTEGKDAHHDVNVFGPFGSSKRKCAGQELNWIELETTLCKLMKTLKFVKPDHFKLTEEQRITVVPVDFKINVIFE